MREIALTRGLVALVSDEDYDTLAQHKWYAEPGRNTYYAARREPGKKIYMHRQIMGFPKGWLVDHENRNGLDNTRRNLHIITKRGNALNTDTVGIYRVNRRWRAQIHRRGKHVHLGYYPTREEALQRRRQAVAEALKEERKLK